MPPLEAPALIQSRVINEDFSNVEHKYCSLSLFVSFRGQLIPVQPTLPSGLAVCCFFVLPLQPKPRPRTQSPRRLLQWKADGRSFDGSRLQSAVQERKLLIRRHPSSRPQAQGGRGGGAERGLTADVWPLSNAFAWQIHGSHSYTHEKTGKQTQRQDLVKHTHIKTHSVNIFWLTFLFRAYHQWYYSFQHWVNCEGSFLVILPPDRERQSRVKVRRRTEEDRERKRTN